MAYTVIFLTIVLLAVAATTYRLLNGLLLLLSCLDSFITVIILAD